MTQYVALIDGKAGAYGVAFPDAPGCTAMGATLEEAYAGAVEALRKWLSDRVADGLAAPAARSLDAIAADPEAGLAEASATVMVPALLDSGRVVRANVSFDAALLETIDEAARERGLTRSAFLASAARDKIAARS